MNTESLVIERTYDSSMERVWQAITNKDAMKKWFFEIAAFEPEVGFQFQFAGTGKDENMHYIHLCEVKEIVPLKKLSYSWKYEGYEGNSLVTFELFAEDTKTKLKLTHAGLETFPVTIPDFAKHNFAEGWTYITGTSLKKFVEA